VIRKRAAGAVRAAVTTRGPVGVAAGARQDPGGRRRCVETPDRHLPPAEHLGLAHHTSHHSRTPRRPRPPAGPAPGPERVDMGAIFSRAHWHVRSYRADAPSGGTGLPQSAEVTARRVERGTYRPRSSRLIEGTAATNSMSRVAARRSAPHHSSLYNHGPTSALLGGVAELIMADMAFAPTRAGLATRPGHWLRTSRGISRMRYPAA